MNTFVLLVILAFELHPDRKGTKKNERIYDMKNMKVVKANIKIGCPTGRRPI